MNTLLKNMKGLPMEIIKYKKANTNEYIITTSKGDYKLYDDIIIKANLLLKKEISNKELEKIIEENKQLEAYYIALKALNRRLKCEKELRDLLKKKEYSKDSIDYAIKRLEKDGYLKHDVYISSYIHDMLSLNVVGESKILNDLINLGFPKEEINPYLEKIDQDIYNTKIANYITKKLKANKKSIKEFKQKTYQELILKGFNKEDILTYLDTIKVKDDEEQIEKLIAKLKIKYLKKYDLNTTKNKIKVYLYQKGYENIDIDKYI